VVFHTGTPWPGVAAALPTLGAAAVIAGGCVRSVGGPGTLLAARPLRRLGDLSYSLYLWHWPLIAVATAYWPGLSTPHRVLVAVASLLPAWLTHRLVENPIRYAPTITVSYRRALAVGGGCTAVGVAAGAVLLGMVAGAVGAGGAGAGSALGAAVLAADPRDDPAGRAPDRVDHVTPDPLRATADVPDVYADGCHQDQRSVEVVSCTYGNVASEVSVAVAGDSKVAQWLPALQLLADHNNWRLTTYTKSACSISDAMIKDGDGRPYASCREWTERVVRRLTTVDVPDYVITSQGANRAFGATGDLSADALAAGLERSWTALVGAGASVIVMADNPHPGFTVYECVTEHADRLSSCTYSRERRRSHGGYAVQRQVVARQPAIRMVDLFDAICPVEPCSPVIGNVLIYRQGSHLTSTYVKTLTPRLAAALSDAGLPAAYGDSDRYRRWHD
jgi:hypothetical protein